MKFLLSLTLCVLAVAAYPWSLDRADECVAEKCKIEENCRCSSVKSPLTEGEAPQLIVLTVNEAIVKDAFDHTWKPLLFDRKNPDGNPISGTFYVPHEYTDYKCVQDLYLRGFEIGVHSITKNSFSDYWKTADVDILTQEFGGQRTLLSHFANIPKEDVLGARTPQLQIDGDVTIQAYVASGVTYDNSWTSRNLAKIFPYTLDFQSTQKCRTGTTCPTEAHPGFWIAPIIDIQGQGGIECNALETCFFDGTPDQIAAWLLGEVERFRTLNRAPLTLMISSAYLSDTNALAGFQKFLDGLGSNVFLVSQKQALDWMKNPVPLEQFKTEVPSRTATCSPINCLLYKGNDEIRYMMSCIPCPEVYPWLGNPYGLLDPNKTTTTSTTLAPTTTTTTTEGTTSASPNDKYYY